MTYQRAFEHPFFAISDGEVSALYNRDDMSVFTVNGDLNCLFDVLGREIKPYLPREKTITDTPRVGDIVDTIKATPLSAAIFGDKPPIYKLTINIANTCNLECSYCYADFGKYHGPAGNMNESQCDKIMEGLDRDFGAISKVQFFGGEPLLNPHILRRFCEKLSRVHPNIEFYVVTNGTTMNDDILEILEKYRVGVTVSIDGPEVVNDANRYDHVGRGSYNRIMDNLDKIRDKKIEFDVECTFNAKHVEHEISVVDLLDFFMPAWED